MIAAIEFDPAGDNFVPLDIPTLQSFQGHLVTVLSGLTFKRGRIRDVRVEGEHKVTLNIMYKWKPAGLVHPNLPYPLSVMFMPVKKRPGNHFFGDIREREMEIRPDGSVLIRKALREKTDEAIMKQFMTGAFCYGVLLQKDN